MLTTMIELAEERRRQLLKDATESHLAAAATRSGRKGGPGTTGRSEGRSHRPYRGVVAPPAVDEVEGREHLGHEHDGDCEREPATPRRRGALLAVVGGIALFASSAAIGLATRPTTPLHAARPLRAVLGPAVAPLPNIGTASETYAPGHTSGWHVHPGVHSVVVLSGTLTIYDENCMRTDYGPGDTYLGGNAPHLAHNEGTDDLDVAVTYVYTSTVPGTPVSAPAGCGVR